MASPSVMRDKIRSAAIAFATQGPECLAKADILQRFVYNGVSVAAGSATGSFIKNSINPVAESSFCKPTVKEIEDIVIQIGESYARQELCFTQEDALKTFPFPYKNSISSSSSNGALVRDTIANMAPTTFCVSAIVGCSINYSLGSSAWINDSSCLVWNGNVTTDVPVITSDPEVIPTELPAEPSTDPEIIPTELPAEPSTDPEIIPTELPAEPSSNPDVIPTELPADPSSSEPSSNSEDVPTEALTNPSPAPEPSSDVLPTEVLVNLSVPLTTINVSEVLPEENSTDYTFPNIPKGVPITTQKSFYNSIPFVASAVTAGALVAGVILFAAGRYFWKKNMARSSYQDSDSGPGSPSANKLCNVIKGILGSMDENPDESKEVSRYDVGALSIHTTPVSAALTIPDIEVSDFEYGSALDSNMEGVLEDGWQRGLVDVSL